MSNKSKSTTFLLCCFLGGLGIHRFYLGKLITGILMLLTAGGFAIWWLIDLYRIITGRLKDKEGNDLGMSQPYAEQPNAGFWVRLSALMVDGLILGLIQFAFIYLPLMAYLYNSGIVTDLESDMDIMAVAPIVSLAQGAVLILYVGYFVALTSGKHQGTYGKRSMGIYVRKRDGGRVWIGHSLVRFVGYIISWIPLGLGYLMAAFHKNKLALHDLIAGTEVVYGAPSEEAIGVDQEAVTETAPRDETPDPSPDPSPDSMPSPMPVPMTMDEARPGRTPEILIGLGMLFLVGTAALAYVR